MRSIMSAFILVFCLGALAGCSYDKPWKASPGLESYNGFRSNEDGCVTFFSNYDYETDFTWSGPCVPTVIDGQTYNLAQGRGSYKVTRLSDGKVSQTYDGEMRNGRYHGRGKMVHYFDDGEILVYVGDWVDDEREGRGRLVYSDGGVYEGSFKNNRENGLGTYYPPKTADAADCGGFGFAKYAGQFKDNYLHGQGASYDANGRVIRLGLWFKSCEYNGTPAEWEKADAQWRATKSPDDEGNE